MPRLQILLPASFAFSTERRIQKNHINNAGHLDNALLLTLVSDARISFFQSLGYDELNIEGLGIVIADAALQYRSEAFEGEEMVIQMAVIELGTKGCDLVWRMTEKQSGREVARGKTGVVFFDYTSRKAAMIPEKVRLVLAQCLCSPSAGTPS